MTALKALKERKDNIAKQLDKVATEKISTYNVMECCRPVAKSLKISPQTVYNYTKGKVKDGYLAEAILSEFQKQDFDKLFNQ